MAGGRLEAELPPCGEAWFGMTWPGDRYEGTRRLIERGPPRGAGTGEPA